MARRPTRKTAIISRRSVLGGMAAATALPLAVQTPMAQASLPHRRGRVNVVVPRNFKPLGGVGFSTYRRKLSNAVLDFLADGYGRGALPVWGRAPSQDELEKRIYNISYWVLKGVEKHAALYPIDPTWIMAQMMAESYFYEFAISWAFAVGICQFIPETARDYGMLVAGDKSEHFHTPYARTELAGRHADWHLLRREARQLRRANARFAADDDTMRDLVAAVLEGRDVQDAEAYLAYRAEAERLEKEITQAREDHITYLRANFEGRDIFNKADLKFLKGFDERVSYMAPVYSMVKLLGENLRARNGNILAATAAYNAGLHRTSDVGCYQPYGRVQAIRETVTYVSRIVVNHHEITRRMGG